MSEIVGGTRAFNRIDRGRVADRILDDLRKRILSGVLPRGTRLPAERELAEQYGVSGATIREAVRALGAMGLVDVRHGSGSYVTAQGDTLIAASIASVVQLEKVGAGDVLGILGVLNAHAAELAVRHATKREIASLRDAALRLEKLASVAQTVADLKEFLGRLSAISHNALLAALCKFLVDVQVELALGLSGGKLSAWQRVAGALHGERMAIVEALEARDAEQAVALVRAYHERAQVLINALPEAKEIRLSDPQLSRLLASLMSSKVALAGVPGEAEEPKENSGRMGHERRRKSRSRSAA